ncbi:porin family protein [Flavobacterium psychrotolerans]|uniref:PorT family protein n=1 Tax=Flavobacterium psychrotolerans TaxID=2169410 RepID=A0A2U1JKB1_9FLAO|nr:porin family protein [Flavobacterium psychrotolerans]PWA05429.1 PorT family protein [Flavobacterium psychrotolerans]
MKKIILTVAAIFAFGFANAQDKGGSDKSMSFGAKAGLNIASITNSDGSSSLVGFHVGGFAEFKVSDKFAVQPELLYSAQGAKFDGGKMNLSYINIPVMAKYYVADAFSLEAGPQIGFLMSAKVKADGGGSADVKEFFKSTDFGVNFGAGYEFTENLSAGLRYNLGLAQVQKELATGESASHNSVIQISLGYKF